MSTATKQRFPLEAARRRGIDLMGWLEGYCERVKIAGSVRRGKAEVGDVELLVIPSFTTERNLFSTQRGTSRTDRRLEVLVDTGVLEYRKSKVGNVTNGEKIKLFRDLESGIPIDIFITDEDSWYNYLVCRTGPADSNINIAKRAKAMGLKWEPYSSGFLDRASGRRIVCKSEREVFDTVELPYRDPEREVA